MTLPPDTRIGPCEVVAPLDAGATGEVYRLPEEGVVEGGCSFLASFSPMEERAGMA